MAKILVYNNNTGRMQTFYRGLSEAMPYNSNRTLTVSEFRSNSRSNILWTDLRCMQAWNSFRYIYGRPIYVGYAFKRPWEGGHSNLSQHYAGLAFDVGQNLDYSSRLAMRNLAYNSGIWSYVEPLNLTPRWVHFDDRWTLAGYPVIRQGSRGPYVCIAQDGLINLGFDTGGLDGIFGSITRNGVIAYQQSRGLSADGIIGNNTWSTLMQEVVGMGESGSTIN